VGSDEEVTRLMDGRHSPVSRDNLVRAHRGSESLIGPSICPSLVQMSRLVQRDRPIDRAKREVHFCASFARERFFFRRTRMRCKARLTSAVDHTPYPHAVEMRCALRSAAWAADSQRPRSCVGRRLPAPTSSALIIGAMLET
jgi:hypothetical protein